MQTELQQLQLARHETDLARHDVRLGNLEAKEKETSDKLDRLLWLLITTLVGTVGSLLFQLLKK